MKNNPFTSNKFTSVWLKHFNNSETAYKFNFIEDVLFVKNKHLPLYANTGKNLTNGISYSLSSSENNNDYKKKAFFLYDVPEYFKIENTIHKSTSLKLIKKRQYKGYLANIEEYTKLEDYINDNFKSKTRRLFNKNIRSLEACFNIKYAMFYGDNITKKQYDFVFEYFNKLLKKRYTEKEIDNHYLDPQKWN